MEPGRAEGLPAHQCLWGTFINGPQSTSGGRDEGAGGLHLTRMKKDPLQGHNSPYKGLGKDPLQGQPCRPTEKTSREL